MADEPNTTGPQAPADQNNQDDLEIVDPDDLKHEQAESPAVQGEGSPSGSAPEESMDIDQAMEEVGKQSDEKEVKPVGQE